jgi:predicted secreted hydrolase
MLFQLRRRDGSRDPHSSGTWVPHSGAPRPITVGGFDLDPRRTWRSPATGASYPVAWGLRIPSEQLTLELRAAVDGQELDVRPSIGIAYWEGAIVASGLRNGKPVSGRGYLELTGYAGPGMGSILQ